MFKKETNNKISLFKNYIYFWTFLIVYIVIIFIYVFGLVDPHNICFKWILGWFCSSQKYYYANFNLFWAIIYWIALFILIFLLINTICVYNKNKLSILSIFLFFLLIIISPSIANKRLWSADSAIHLYIICLLSSGKTLDGNISDIRISNYTNFFYHKFYVHLSRFTKIDPHSLFLYFTPIFQFSLFFLGLYLLFFTFFEKNFDENHSNLKKNIIFSIYISLAINFTSIGPMIPNQFIILFIPLILVLIYKFSLKKLVIVIFINIIVVNTHVYGYFICILSIIGLMLKFLFYFFEKKINEKCFQLNYSHILYFNIFLFISLLILIFFPKLITGIVSIMPISQDIKIYFLSNWYSGGTFIRERYQDSLYRITWTLIRWLITFFAIINIQIQYLSTQNKVKKFNFNFKNFLYLFVEISSIPVILSLFYGKNLLLYRIQTLVISLHLLIVLLSFYPLILKLLLHFQKIFKSKKYITKNFLLNKKKMQVFFVLSIMLSSLSVYERNISYTREQYNAAKWISKNTPDDARFVTSNDLTSFISGLTMRWSTRYMNRFFQDFDKDLVRMDYFPESRLYIFIDLDPPPTFAIMPTFHGNLSSSIYKNDNDLFIEKLNNTSIYNIVYFKENIMIFEIIR